ncbi:LysR family transcriptional regulator [Chelatococcus reniformis]|uniref:LysR family transcriptional regulator n=1 Tax=Chelatococcus reniformis TaxID=1494448 RepID=A0A916U5U2_9HYPH|nr:LysR family transcriptional regulator [Chelatococcus reniformis]GGC61313.1 LysR family transcriptional regulator [Chelatococcus reniformis]
MRTLNLDQLNTFVDVIELGSFSAAAERQELSQPAVSLQIRQLERRLGVPLIERVGRTAKPTAAGADLLAHAAQIDAAVAAALDAMTQYRSDAMGRVRLGTGATACIFMLPPILRQLREQFPDFEIAVSTGNSGDVVRAVEENTIDIGLVTLPASGRMLEVTPLLRDEFVLIAPPGAPMPRRPAPSEVARMPLLMFEGGNTRRITDEWFARGQAPLRPAMSLGSVEAIKELVSAGLGYAVLPAMAVRPTDGGARFSVRPLAPRLYRTLAIVVRRDKRMTRGLRELDRALRRLATQGAD